MFPKFVSPASSAILSAEFTRGHLTLVDRHAFQELKAVVPRQRPLCQIDGHRRGLAALMGSTYFHESLPRVRPEIIAERRSLAERPVVRRERLHRRLTHGYEAVTDRPRLVGVLLAKVLRSSLMPAGSSGEQ